MHYRTPRLSSETIVFTSSFLRKNGANFGLHEKKKKKSVPHIFCPVLAAPPDTILGTRRRVACLPACPIFGFAAPPESTFFLCVNGTCIRTSPLAVAHTVGHYFEGPQVTGECLHTSLAFVRRKRVSLCYLSLHTDSL